jgi:tetratricopeptide (TPR) repeat protein
LIPRARWITGGACLLVAALGGAGCAAHQSRLAQRFIKAGTPSVALQAAAPRPVENTMRDYVRKVRDLQARARPHSSLLPTLESTDPMLSKALLALAIDESADRHVMVADAYRNAGVTDYAFRHYLRATTLEPCSAAGYDGMARLWRDWGRPDIAMGDAYRAAYCNPNSADVYNTLGTIMSALGQTGNAREAYRKSLSIDGHNAPALTNLGYMALQAGRADEAVRFCAEALKASPGFEPARNNLALAYVFRGDYAAAQQVLQPARNAVAQYNLGVLRLATGDYGLAAEAFDTAAALQPSMRIARDRAVQARRAAQSGERGNGTDGQR